jgi:L-asparaginase
MVIMRVALFTLGGTIASTHDLVRAGDVSAPPGSAPGVAPTLKGADLLAAVPGLNGLGIELDVHDFLQVPGPSITIPDVVALAAAIRRQIAAGAVGAVVTQGTDTIEETAFLLDLLAGDGAPVVVTGAMRNPTLAGADGPANVLSAVQVAASPAVRDLGCVVVFGDEIHAARYVRKSHTTSVAAFTSPSCGPLGLVAEGRVVMLAFPPVRGPGAVLPVLPVPATRPDGTAPSPVRAVRTALVTMVLGDDGELLRGAADRFDGLVIAGFGAGHVPGALAADLGALAARIPVVIASRAGAGLVLAHTYSFPGSERDLRERGLIGAGFLDPLKARILLHMLLAGGSGHEEIAAAFRTVAADPGGPVYVPGYLPGYLPEET